MEESSGWKRVEGDFGKFLLIMEIPPPQYPSFPFIPLIPKQALRERRETISTSRFPMSCLGLPNRNTIPQTIANGCEDLYFLTQRRVFCEPWQ
jgi:hypothetical protein